MNVERLKDLADSVLADQIESNIEALLANVEVTFAQSFQSPSPQTADAFETQLTALTKETLEKSPHSRDNDLVTAGKGWVHGWQAAWLW